ncbi:hypothetical protein AMTR_s00067p00204940 [Amborella trichopoda]|uniref:DUF659 domain-containing protein n=1 Tax=Amborella trichopoda TaxID=13333 RepID=U5D902_AMBTC|nr:hypothetical protein AMTR_s00067p00204940 [Amborella trichopoda]
MDAIGEEHVVQVIFNAKKLIRRRWSPCPAHCIDLILEDNANLKLKKIVDAVKVVTKIVYNYHSMFYMMRKHNDERKLFRPCNTCFAT